MLHEKYLDWGYTRNCMRELSAYGSARKQEIGAERVYDFGLGNPNVPPPPAVREAIDALNRADPTEIWAETPAAGLPATRQAVAEDLSRRCGVAADPSLVYVTCAATGALALCCHGLLCPGDEAVLPAPYFTEYRVFVEGARGVPVIAPPRDDMSPDLDALERALTERTKFVLLNSPNNPAGTVLSGAELTRLAEILRAAGARYGHPVYLVTDEPYREIVYGTDRVAPSALGYYENTVVCYSLSKALSLPGERIGYLAVHPGAADARDVFDALTGASAALGYRCAPSMMQRLLAECLGQTADMAVYRRNRDLLYGALTEIGFRCVKPEGAFYLFVRSPEPDARQCSERAKRYELLLVPSDDFGVAGWLRLAYCVPEDMIRRSLPAFRLLAAEYGLGTRVNENRRHSSDAGVV